MYVLPESPYRRLGGASLAMSDPPQPGDRLRFVFVFVSCVSCVRAEAKLCVRVRRASLTLGLGSAEKSRFRAVWGAIVAGRKRGFYQLFMVYFWLEA